MDVLVERPTVKRHPHPRRDGHPRGGGADRPADNVEIARRSFAAFNRSVADGVEDYYEMLDPEIDWIPITALLDGRRYRGPEGVRRWVDEVRRDWRVFEIRWAEVSRPRRRARPRVRRLGLPRTPRRRADELRPGRLADRAPPRQVGPTSDLVDRAEALESAGLSS
jgi:hypothetical protein